MCGWMKPECMYVYMGTQKDGCMHTWMNMHMHAYTDAHTNAQRKTLNRYQIKLYHFTLDHRIWRYTFSSKGFNHKMKGLQSIGLTSFSFHLMLLWTMVKSDLYVMHMNNI